MKEAGAGLMFLGVMVALFAFMMDTSVTTSGTFIGGTYVGGGSAHNLGLMQYQMMVFQSGLAAFVAGAFLYGSAAQRAGHSRSEAPHARRHWTDLRDGETDEERDERVARQRRRERITVGAVFGLIVLLAVLATWSTSAPEEDNYMNVDTNVDATLDAVASNLTLDNRTASESP